MLTAAPAAQATGPLDAGPRDEVGLPSNGCETTPRRPPADAPAAPCRPAVAPRPAGKKLHLVPEPRAGAAPAPGPARLDVPTDSAAPARGKTPGGD